TARMRDGYQYRQLGLALLFVLGCALFLYDGFYAYPRQAEIYQAYQTWQQGPQEQPWDQFKEPDWPDDARGEPGKERTDKEIRTQQAIGLALIPAALLLLARFALTYRRYITLAQGVITTQRGER